MVIEGSGSLAEPIVCHESGKPVWLQDADAAWRDFIVNRVYSEAKRRHSEAAIK